jgi:hypothetical protein
MEEINNDNLNIPKLYRLSNDSTLQELYRTQELQPSLLYRSSNDVIIQNNYKTKALISKFLEYKKFIYYTYFLYETNHSF